MYISYTRKSIGNKFLDYLGPTIFNAMPLYLEKYFFNNINKNNYNFYKKISCKLAVT